jgi:hypothetical protein
MRYLFIEGLRGYYNEYSFIHYSNSSMQVKAFSAILMEESKKVFLSMEYSVKTSLFAGI